jgi:AmmeMemoRadiSam system protein A
MISEPAKTQLLALARAALEARVRRERAPVPDAGGVLGLRRGAFVTIHHRGELRGCLGRLTVDSPLGRTIVHLGGAVADSDPRFASVIPSELTDIQIEISVLTPEERVMSIDDIEVGRHGLIIEDGYARGLLLPQVATEHEWDRETFLAHTCLKAGLPPDAWKNGARILVFEADVFGERAATPTPTPTPMP